MCNLCYLSFGRDKLATNCPHQDKMNYAQNMCLTCYHRKKHTLKKHRAINKEKKAFHKTFLTDAALESLDIFILMDERDPEKKYNIQKAY